MLVDKEDYLEAGVNIGSRRHVKDMDEFIFRVKKNNLSILDLEKTDERIKRAAELLSQYEPDDILAVSRKKNGHTPVVTFSEATGARRIFGRFMPGTLTNPNSEDFIEPDVLIVTDPEEDWPALQEAVDANIVIVAVADSANSLDYVDYVIPANNKGRRSLALLYYLLARETLKGRGELASDDGFDYTIEDFEEEEPEDEDEE